MNCENPLVSIIIPVFNSASTLRQCVESIQSQTFTHWILWLIDDGSTDKSFDICKIMASDDTRIHILHQSHQGVSVARNLALDKVKEQYICFVDADDIIEPDYLESLLKYRDYDMVISGYFVDAIDSDGNLLNRETHLPCEVDILHVKTNRFVLLSLFMTGKVHPTWNKLIHSSMVKKYHIRFSPIPINEDYLFMLEYLNHCDSIKTVNKAIYHWVRIEGKNTGVSSMPDNLLQIYNLAHERTREFFQDNIDADSVFYHTYCLILDKYYKAYEKNEINKCELNIRLNSFKSNLLVKSSFLSYKPNNKGEWIMNTILRHGCFQLYRIINRLLLLS